MDRSFLLSPHMSLTVLGGPLQAMLTVGGYPSVPPPVTSLASLDAHPNRGMLKRAEQGAEHASGAEQTDERIETFSLAAQLPS